MKKLTFLLIPLTLLCWNSSSDARERDIYKQSNNAANYIKLISFPKDRAKVEALNQPYNFTEDQMADILRSLRYNRRAVFSDKVKTRKIYEEETIEKYTPYLVKAFKKAGPEDAVYFSVAQKRPWYVVRNDHLTQVEMWVIGQELHMRFGKTEAKLLGDYQARTPEGRKMRREAVGLRISLEPQEGQKLSFDSSQEVILDINSNWEAIVLKIEAEEEQLRQQMEYEKARGSKKKKLKAELDKQNQSTTTAAPVSEKDRKGAEQRLQELKKLKDKGLIDQEDYDKKKEEILKTL